jgi:zinc protease
MRILPARWLPVPVVALVVLLATCVPALAASSLQVPPLQYHERTLANGLQVISVEDHASPTVAVQVWYHVGSKDDPQGRSGFAHLFEHLMFKGTAHMRDEQMDRLTEDVGGNNNASTGGDITNYFEIVPSNYLQTLLWAEAERLSNLKVDDKNFKSERAVVQEEYRQRVLADPYGKLFNSIDAHSYVVHPYKRPTIGNIEELDAASLQDVLDFHKTYYRPDNATLIVTGDFDPKQLDAWVDRYFGWIAKPASAIPQVAPIEPARSQDKRYTETSETAPLPGLAMTWLIPPASDPDYIPLQVAGALLSQGDSSRLYQSLVYQHQVAQQVGAFADGRVGTGLFTAYAILASGHAPDEAETLLRAEISRLATQPIPADELDKIRTQLLTDQLKQRQTAQGIGFAIGQAVLTEGDPARVNSDLVALQAVTADDVQRVLRKYVTDAHSVTIDYLPQAKAGESAGKGEAK